MNALSLPFLTDAARNQVTFWEQILEPLCAVTRQRARAIADTAARHGIPEPTVRSKFYAFQRGGVAALVDKRLCGPAAWNTDRTALNLADRELVKLYCENNQRGNKPAIRLLLEDWRKGKVTSSAPLDPATGYPRGWSERNLLRFAPTKYELKAVRIGRTAAASERRLVYTTRADLWVGSHYMFDDMWHDHFVNNLDKRQAGRPLEFHALDLYSANKFAWGMRVRTEVDGRMEGLKSADMRFLLAYVLGGVGYSPRGTKLIVEHGTAAISKDLEKLIFEATHGLVTVERSGMEGAAAAAHQYAGRSKGNFRFKAALESLGNLIHGEMAALPGQTGKDRDHRPEQLHGLLKYNDGLLCALSQLSAERIEMLQWPLITIQQFLVIASEIYERINARTEHRLEGWDLHYVPCRQTGGMRRMSPSEVWQRGKRDLIPLAPEITALIIGFDQASERTVRRGMIELTDPEVSGDLLRFDASRLGDGAKCRAILNPYKPDTLFAFDDKGRFLSACPRIRSVDRGDAGAVQRACGAVAKAEADALAPLRARHTPQAREKLAMQKHNISVITGAPVTAEEKADALQGKRAAALGRAMAHEVNSIPGDPAHASEIEDWSDAPPITQPPTPPVEAW